MISRLSISGNLPAPSRRVSIALRVLAPVVVGAVALAVSLAVSTTGALGAVALNEIVIQDTFNGTSFLDGRTPSPVATSSTWAAASAVWLLNGGVVHNTEAGSHFGLIDTGISDGGVEVDLTWTTGDTAGVVARYIDASNWLRVTYDGTVLLLEQNVSGSVTTVATSSQTWSSTDTKTITIGLDGSTVTVRLDASLEITATPSGTLASNTLAGIFTDNTLSEFDNFKVTTLDLSADAGPDQTVDAGDLVTLDGSASESFSVTNSSLTFLWSQASGTAVTLSSTSVSGPTFTAPAVSGATEFTFQLQVTDTNGSTTDTVSIFIGPGTNPFGTTFISDEFTDSEDTFLSTHSPDTASTTWASISGKWLISSNTVGETSGSVLVDHRAVIDTETSDGTVQVDITLNQQQAGLVTRYASESNWIMAWFDDNLDVTPGTGDILLGQVVDGVFTNLGQATSTVWGIATGTTRTLSIKTEGQDITVSLDSTVVLTATSSDLLTNTKMGLFSRASTSNVFDNFKVTALPLTADAGPDQLINPVIGPTIEITLDGSASESNNITDPTLSFLWTQDSGPAISLSSASAASPTFDAAVATSSAQYIFTLIIDDIDGSATDTVTILISALSDAPSGLTFLKDTFTDIESTLLSDHIPEIASSTWTVISGDWEIGSDKGLENSGTTSTDHRAIIDAGTADGTVQADITLNGQIAGVVTRYQDESNWIMVWFDNNRDSIPGTGDIVLAQLDSGIFTILEESIGVVWGASSTRTLAVTADGSEITVLLDSVELFSDTSTVSATSTGVGIFSRATSTNAFDNFEVSALPLAADAGPDQVIVPVSGTSTAVTLDGSGSASHNIDNSSITFAWVQDSGTSVTLSSASVAGPAFDAPETTSTSEFVFTLTVTDIDGSATDTVSILITPASEAPSGTTLITDTFSDIEGISLSVHTPDVASSTWSVISGDWTINGSEELEEGTGADDADNRAVIDAGADETIVSADITLGGGAVGLVTRYEDESNWIMAWFDDNRSTTPGTGDIILAQLVDNTFTILGESFGINWTATSSDRNLSVKTSREDVTVSLNGVELFSATSSSSLATSTGVGVFSRASSTNIFDNFNVIIPPLVANAGPDQAIVSDSGEVTLDASDSRSHSLVDQSLTYLWTQTSGTSTPTLSSATSSTPTFEAPTVSSAEELVFEVTITETISSATSTDSVSILITTASAAPSGDTLVEDAFTDLSGVLLVDHVPDTATSTWSVISGDWEINSSGELEEVSGTDAADHRAIIESTSGETIHSADITLSGGAVGLIVRYEDESNWIMAWFDDNRSETPGTGDIILAQLVDGTFTNLGISVGFDWTASSSIRNLSVTTSREDIIVKLDGIELISATSSDLATSTGIGFFSRASSTNAFDNLLVTLPPLVADAGPDQSVVTTDGDVALDGTDSRSHSLVDQSLTYLWAQTSGTSTPALSSATSSTPTFDPSGVTEVEELVFTLTITETVSSATSSDTVSIFVSPASAPPSGDTLIDDSFTDLTGVSLENHIPDIAPATWSVVSGVWTVNAGDALEELSGTDAADFRAVIDSGSDETVVEANISLAGGAVGLVTRYEDESNWIMAWFDDNRDSETPGTGDIILAQLVDGVFTTLGESFGFDWTATGTVRNLSVTTSREDIIVELDGVELISATSSDLSTSTSVGFFSRASSTNTFDDFLVTLPPLVANAGPDQTVDASAGDVALDGSDSRSHSLTDQSLTFLWAQTSGTSTPALSSATSSTPTFDPSGITEVEELIFTLTVTETTSSATSSDTVSIVVSPGSAAPSGDTLIDDSFADLTDVSLENHFPDIAASTWSVVSGNWTINSGDELEEISGSDVADFRAVIDSGSGETIVEANITFAGGAVGLVTRYEDESNWIMAWFDDNRNETPGTGDIILAQLVGGVFTTLGEAFGFDWTATGTVRNLSVTTSREDITVALDGIELISASSAELATSTGVGFFSRASSTNAFDDFLVTLPPLVANAGPNQSVVTSGGDVILDGSDSRSHSLVDQTLTFAWTQTSGTTTPALSSATSSTPTFDPSGVTEVEELVFTLTITETTSSATTSDTVSIFVSPGSTAPSGDTLIDDPFADLTDVSLENHFPDIAASTWSVVSGDWTINASDELEEVSGTDITDFRAVIDAGASEAVVEADITLGGGAVGLITRYEDESNWIMAWFDDNRDTETSGTGDIILAQLVDGIFTTLGESAGFDWTASSTTRNMSIITSRNDISVELNGLELISVSTPDLATSTGVGMFSRASSTNIFDNFLVTIPALVANAGPDQAIVNTDGDVTLDGTDSRSHSISDQTLTFAWTQATGTSVSIASATSSEPTFDPSGITVVEELIFTLTITETISSATSTDTVSVFVSPASALPSGDTLVDDKFTDLTGVNLGNHLPDVASSTWSVFGGTWTISASDKVEEVTGTDVTDYRAIIDAGASETIVEANITFASGAVGLVTRYEDESNWIMAWFDDNRNSETPGTGAIVLAQLFDNTFTILGESLDVDWTATGTTRNLSLITSREDISVELDGLQLISVTSGDLATSTGVGIFSRASSTNVFDNFLVSIPPIAANAGSDQTAVFDSATTTVVTLDGSDSRSHSIVDQTLTYSWLQTSGASISLSSATTSGPTFDVPDLAAAEELVFTLTITETTSSATTEDTVSIFVKPESDAPSGDTLVIDTFTDLTNVSLTDHVPDVAASIWSIVAGDWTISSADELEDTSATDAIDHRAVIDVGANDAIVQATITFGGGSVGLVTRYGNESNWIMAWFDDSRDVTPGTGDILLAQLVGGTFSILQESLGVNWTATGTDRTLSLSTEGEEIIVKLDGIQLISATSSDLSTSTSVGIFSRASSTNAFEDFTVSLPPLTADAGPDQTVVFDSATTTVVTLDGSASKSHSLVDQSLTFSWVLTTGSVEGLAGTTTSSPTFDVPDVSSAEELIFTLTITETVSSDTATSSVSIFVKPEPATPSGSTLIVDTFTDLSDTELANHYPDTASGTWTVVSGDWTINSSDELEDATGTDITDHRAIIDVGDADTTVEVDITLAGGSVGIVTRYADESNWIMAWFDDSRNVTPGTGDIILAQLVDGTFSVIGRLPDVAWTEATATRRLSLITSGEDITVELDSNEIISATSSDLLLNTKIGFFSRATSTNVFDTLDVTATGP